MREPNQLFEELKTLQAQKRLPPVKEWHPDRTGTIDIRIAADGTWYHEGTAFARPALVRLFSTILRRDEDGYFLVTPHERLKIIVEDAPFVAVGLEANGQGEDQELGLRTNTDDVVFAGAEHRLWVEEGRDGPRPYVHVRDGLNALLSRPVYYQLVALGEVQDGHLWVTSNGARFDLGSTT
ncbi:MAG: DUF1285 domain-containing protein [Gammaproteobacteria bacterium]|nr:DUF1285 domain-containing protein [Gammaproteobacteria bacterium]